MLKLRKLLKSNVSGKSAPLKPSMIKPTSVMLANTFSRWKLMRKKNWCPANGTCVNSKLSIEMSSFVTCIIMLITQFSKLLAMDSTKSSTFQFVKVTQSSATSFLISVITFAIGMNVETPLLQLLNLLSMSTSIFVSWQIIQALWSTHKIRQRWKTLKSTASGVDVEN